MSSEHARVVERIYTARRDGLAITAEADPPLTNESALAVQLAVLAKFAQDGRTVGGWKAALSSGNGRDLLGPGFRPFGYVLRDRIFKSGAHLRKSKILGCKIEPELCVVMGAALRGSDVDAADVRAAVRAIAPAYEVNELRVARNLSRTLLVADGLAQWGIVVGEEVPVDRYAPPLRVQLTRDGQLLQDATPGADIDDPFLTVARMVHAMDRHGIGLQAGQPVITGSFCHQDIDVAGRYRAEFSGVGAVEAIFE